VREFTITGANCGTSAPELLCSAVVAVTPASSNSRL
jgi:hypothetical protein